MAQPVTTQMSRQTSERRKVLMAVDSSEYAEYAFDWYVKYLYHQDHEILAMHMVEGFDIAKAQKEVAKGGQMKESLEKKISKITELEERYRHKLHDRKIKGEILSVPCKDAGPCIIDTAREEGVFCIVMGTRNRSKLKKAIMGSVSNYVMNNADIPVIVVRKRLTKTEIEAEGISA